MSEAVLTLDMVRVARQRMAGAAHITPLEYSHTFSRLTGNNVFLKLENTQKTGSFKIRGAYNKVMSLSGEEKARGVIAASAGNHAQGVAYAAARAGLTSAIVMPEGAPISKIMAARGYGAQVILAGGGYDEAYHRALELQATSGATFIHGFDDVEIMAGQGTIALELLEQMPDLEAVLVPVGGGGLIAGISLAIKKSKPSVRIIGVQAGGAPAMYRSYREGALIESSNTSTFADGIAIRRPGKLAFEIIRSYVDDIITVDDEEIAGAILMLLERSKLVVEGAGAVGLASLIYHKTSLTGANTAVVLSGGNIDVNILSIIIERGLAKSGRYVRLRTTLTDRPGSLQKLLSVVAQTHANVISINHDRIRPGIPLKQAEVQLDLETRDQEHIQEIVSILKKSNYLPEII
ncbi:L-threonine dehydratase catabolic TdcB [Pelotomaculum sp. FP]|uniref:threonine ammonia-lyase n=1 Tax=Pelotomaculum sp. FP TaxID=261474 RepID=UPI001065414A|nr:threonine ammonia-lyase [Pelotomaculum sp. FP]TEB17184.1 L-threonine dehydratase catabolic TdcB [Pelotomaculum sp. FP]